MKDEPSELKHKDIWTFEYRGITVEIQRWDYPQISGVNLPWKTNWNYYLYLHLIKMPKKHRKLSWLKPDSRGCSDYYKSWFSQLEWHGEITYYHKHNGQIVQVGCDYQHYMDEGKKYSHHILKKDAMKTIDSLFEIIDYK